MKKMIAYLGIDPGKTGAVTLLHKDKFDGLALLNILDWSDVTDIACAVRAWKNTYDIKLAVLEKVHAMPKQGVTSTFSLGENFGSWQGILSSCGIPYELVTPQKWQRGLFRKTDGDGKKRSLAVVRRLYPDSDYFKRVKDHDRADATLMARYAMNLNDK